MTAVVALTSPGRRTQQTPAQSARNKLTENKRLTFGHRHEANTATLLLGAPVPVRPFGSGPLLQRLWSFAGQKPIADSHNSLCVSILGNGEDILSNASALKYWVIYVN